MRRFGLYFAAALLLAVAAFAQSDANSDEAEDNGFLINFLEKTISGPGRQIRLSGVEGALSSQARIGQLSISDDTGPWIELNDVSIDWSRLDLLRGRLNVEKLELGKVNILRKPVPVEKPPVPEVSDKQFAMPELPVSVRLEALIAKQILIAEEVFGEAAELTLAGSLSLIDGTLGTALNIKRQDEPGGTFSLAAGWSNEDRTVAVDLNLNEPAGGLVSRALKIENDPSVVLLIKGEGPVEDVDFTFSLDADDEQLANGLLTLRGQEDGLGFDLALDGGLSPLVPADFRDFFQGRTKIAVQGLKRDSGGFLIDDVLVEGPVLNAKGRLATGEDGFLRNLNMSGSLGDPEGPEIILPVPGATTRIHSAQLFLNYGAASRWNGLLSLDRLMAAGIEFEDVTFDMGGRAENLEDAETRDITVSIEGLATGIDAADPQVAEAIGERLDLFVDAALPANGRIELRQFQVAGDSLSVFSAGNFENQVYEGRTALRLPDLAVLSGIARRPLGGSVVLHASGSVATSTGAFEIELDGTADDVQSGDDRLDALLDGKTVISGTVVRDTSGFRTEDVKLENQQVFLSTQGHTSSQSTDIRFDARIADIGLIDARTEGALSLSGEAKGSGLPVDVTLSADLAEGRIMDREVAGLSFGFNGEVEKTRAAGTLHGGGSLGDLPIDLGGILDVSKTDQIITGLKFELGPTLLTGDISRSEGQPIEGTVSFHSPDIGPLASLALMNATGAADADIVLNQGATGQGIEVDATAQSISVAGISVELLETDFSVNDALNLPMVEGDLTSRGIIAAGFDVSEVNATAQANDNDQMNFAADATLAIGTRADLSGELERLPEGFAATLNTLRLQQDQELTELAAPATVTLSDGTVALTPLKMNVGAGSLTAEGSISEELDISVALDALPVALANMIRPALGLTGDVSGNAKVTGSRSAPDIAFDFTGQGLGSKVVQAADLPLLSASVKGTSGEGALNLDATLSGEGLSAAVDGTVPLGKGDLDLKVQLDALPLKLIDRVAGSQGLGGTVSGTADITGPLNDPAATFDIAGKQLTLAVLKNGGIPPLAVSVAGMYRKPALDLSNANISGPFGTDVNASGRIPFGGSGLDLSVVGQVPLDLATPFLAKRAASASGTLNIDTDISGALTAPSVRGSATLANGTFADPGANLNIKDIGIDLGFEGNAVRINRLVGTPVAGGSISGSGSVVIDPNRGFPADVAVRFDKVRYTDGAFAATQFSGDLNLSGPVTNGALLSGDIVLDKTEISIAEGPGAGAGELLEQVQHLNPPQAVRKTLERAEIEKPEEKTQSKGNSAIRLDINVSAPRRIFIRGRGLDAELGGDVTITGPADNIVPVGEFELRRGRILILVQRLDFTEGDLTLDGDLDPLINFVAETVSGEITARVSVTGRVSDPEITFSSDPELPEDEVLAQILFNQSSSDLSTFQLAQLAAAAAELSGVGGGSILSRLRGSTGLDNLDVLTDEDGATAVRAGKYIDEDIYLDVQTDSEGVSRAGVVLDLTESLSAEGSVDSDGNTIFGLFFKRDF